MEEPVRYTISVAHKTNWYTEYEKIIEGELPMGSEQPLSASWVQLHNVYKMTEYMLSTPHYVGII